MKNLQELAVILSSILGVGGYASYFYGIYAGRVKPHPVTWFIWAAATGIVAATSWTAGAGNGVWATAATAGMCLMVALTALRRHASTPTRGEAMLIVVIIIALLIWRLTRDPFTAVTLITLVDILAFAPTWRKAWKNPHEEDILTFTISAVKFALVLAALKQVNWTTMLYPMVQVMMFVAFIAMLLWRRGLSRQDSIVEGRDC